MLKSETVLQGVYKSKMRDLRTDKINGTLVAWDDTQRHLPFLLMRTPGKHEWQLILSDGVRCNLPRWGSVFFGEFTISSTERASDTIRCAQKEVLQIMTPTEKCLAAYDHVLKILEINNDNYFKRTQILMIVAQSALFIGFVKILTVKKDTLNQSALITKPLALIALFVIALLGSLSAVVWIHFIRRQSNVLNLCKSYLKCIENSLMQFHVPSGYWTYEGMMSHPESYGASELIMPFKIDTDLFPFPLKTHDDKPFQSRRYFQFPYKEGKKFRIGLTGIEQGIAWFLFGLWAFIAYIIGLSVLMTRSNLLKELDMNTTAWFLLIYAALPTIALIVVCVRTYGSKLSKIESTLSEIQQQLREPCQTTKQDHEAQAAKEGDTPQE